MGVFVFQRHVFVLMLVRFRTGAAQCPRQKAPPASMKALAGGPQCKRSQDADERGKRKHQTSAPGTESPLGQQSKSAGSGRSPEAPMLNRPRLPQTGRRLTISHAKVNVATHYGAFTTPPGPVTFWPPRVTRCWSTPGSRCHHDSQQAQQFNPDPPALVPAPAIRHPPAATTWQRLPACPWPRRTSARPAPQ